MEKLKNLSANVSVYILLKSKIKNNELLIKCYCRNLFPNNLKETLSCIHFQSYSFKFRSEINSLHVLNKFYFLSSHSSRTFNLICNSISFILNIEFFKKHLKKKNIVCPLNVYLDKSFSKGQKPLYYNLLIKNN